MLRRSHKLRRRYGRSEFTPGRDEFRPGQLVVVKEPHGSPGFRNDGGQVVRYVPFGKYYVDLYRNGRRLVDASDLEAVYLGGSGVMARVGWR